jgi:hypothetical protein
MGRWLPTSALVTRTVAYRRGTAVIDVKVVCKKCGKAVGVAIGADFCSNGWWVLAASAASA